MKKLIALLTSATLTASMITSCGKNNDSSQTEHKWQKSETLNEWQKNLLEAEGLPTDIEQLTPVQKRSIQHIYEMITYLNEKYNEEFVYAGYVGPGLMEEETLYARSLSDKKHRAVTVKIDDNGDFIDDYQGASVADYCEKLIGDYVRSYFDSKDVAYFMSVNANKLDSMKEVENEDFNWDIGLQNSFFLSNDQVTKEEIAAFLPELAKWLFDHKIVSRNTFKITKNVDLKKVTYSNNKECYVFENCVYHQILTIDEKNVITSSSDDDPEYFDTKEYVNNVR